MSLLCGTAGAADIAARPSTRLPANVHSGVRAAERFFSDVRRSLGALSERYHRLRRRGTVPSAAPAPLAMVVGLGPVGTIRRAESGRWESGLAGNAGTSASRVDR